MGFLVSPGVEIKETDLTDIVPAQSTSIGGYAGYFRWGPSGRLVTVGSENDLAKLFGTPEIKGEIEVSFLTAASFLKYGNALKISRAAGDAINATSGTAALDPLAVGEVARLWDFLFFSFLNCLRLSIFSDVNF